MRKYFLDVTPPRSYKGMRPGPNAEFPRTPFVGNWVSGKNPSRQFVNRGENLLRASVIVTIETICTGSSRERRKDDREANRADASEPTSKEPENYFWVARSAHASVNCWVFSVLWSHNSSSDNDHVAADFQGPKSTPTYWRSLRSKSYRPRGGEVSFGPLHSTPRWKEQIMRIAVVGATGLVGSALVRAAQAAGHDVIALSKESGVDVLQPEGLADLLGGTEAVVDVT